MDLSLYTEESQLKKRKAKKRKATSPIKTDSKVKSTKKSPEVTKVRKVAPKPAKAKTVKVVAKVVAKKATINEAKKAAAQGRAERAAKRRAGEQPIVVKSSPVLDQKKAKVLAKVARKAVSGPQKHQAPAKSK